MLIQPARAAQRTTETFASDAAGWETRSSLGTGFWDWDATATMYLQFAPIGFPFPDTAFMSASNGASGGRFVGNWTTAGVDVVGFEFIATNVLPSTVELRLTANSGALFAFKGFTPPPVGDRIRFAVSAETAAGGGWGGITEADFARLRTNVQEVAIAVKRSSANDEYYYVDNVFLDRVHRWDGGGSGTGSLWLSSANWFADGLPGSNSIVVFASTGSAATIGLDMAAATGSVIHLGQLNVTAADRTFENVSTTSNGIVNLYALNGLLLSNDASTVVFRNGPSRTLGLRLLANGEIYAGGTVAITNAIVSEAGGARRITKTGPGTLLLGATNTFSGGTVVNRGTILFLSGTNAMGAGTAQPNPGGTAADGLALNQPFVARIAKSSAGTVALGVDSSSNLDFSATGASLTNASLGAVGAATYAGTLTPFTNIYRLGGGEGVLTVTSALVSNRSLVAFGAGSGGTLVLAASNSFSGGLRIQGGTVLVSNAHQLGTAAITNAAGLLALGDGFSGARPLVLAGTNANLDVPAGNATWSGPISGTGQIRPSLSGGTLILSASATNNQALVLERGALVLSNATLLSSQWLLGRSTGALFAVTLAATSTATVGTGGVQLCTSPNGATNAASGTLTLTGGELTAPFLNVNAAGAAASTGTVSLAGGTLRVGAIIRTAPGAGELRLGGGTLAATGSTTSFIAGLSAAYVDSAGTRLDTGTNEVVVPQALLAGSPSGGLVKLGAGTLTLSATNTWTGGTTISNGTLRIAASGSIGASTVVRLAPGALLDVSPQGTGFVVAAGQTLGGEGAVTGDLTIAGTLAPGNGVGTLALQSALTFATGGTFLVEVAAPSSADQVALSGTAALGGTLAVTNLGGTLAAGQAFTVMTASAFSGAFATTNLPALATGLQWNVSTAGELVLRVETVPLVLLSVADAAVTEGNAGTTVMSFPVTLSATAAVPVTVAYTTMDGAASHPVDYLASSGTLTFAAGTTAATVNVTINGDTVFENDESLLFMLSNPTNASLADATAVGTILNDDAAPQLSIGDRSAFEGDSGTTFFAFPLTLSQSAPVDVLFSYTVSGLTADGSDLATGSGQASIPAGSVTGTLLVAVYGDTAAEGNETFLVELFAATNALLGDAQGAGTILNDDNVPTVSIGDVAADEGNAGASNFAFAVTLSATSAVNVTVQYATAAGSATPGGDFTPASGTLTIPAGQLSGLVQIAVGGDALFEADESFVVTLATPTNALPGDTSGAGTILNDDPLPALAIGPATVTEGNAGTTNLVFPVTLDAPAGVGVAVQFATADGTAIAGSDYTAAAGTLTLFAGDTATSIVVAVTGDTNAEPYETMAVQFTDATNATLVSTQAVGTILPDDGVPSLSVSDVSAAEGQTGTSNFVFVVSLSEPAAFEVSVNYATAAGTASNGSDFAAITGLLTVAAGNSSGVIAVAVQGDTLHEADESFTLQLSSPTNALIADGSAAGSILNDDDAPTFVWSDAAIGEGNAGTVTAIVHAALSAPSALPASFTCRAAAGTATPGVDFIAETNAFSFAPFATNLQIAVVVAGDALFESAETVLLGADDASGLLLADTQAVVTIANDDAAPVVNVSAATVSEGNAGVTTLVFAVALDVPSGLPVVLPFAATGGTATAGSDFTSATGTLVLAAGSMGTNVAIDVQGDGMFESDETVLLDLGPASNATLATTQAVGTIVNDDLLATLSVADASVLEGQTGETSLVFVVTLSQALGVDATVQFASADGTAVEPADYGTAGGTLTIPAGDTSAVVSVAVQGDALFEADETLTLTLTGPTNAILADAEATGTIVNDDGAPVVAIGDGTVLEGDVGSAQLFFTVSIASPAGVPVTVHVATSNGTALSGTDYVATSIDAVIPAGSTAAVVQVEVLGDTLHEADELFAVHLAAPTNAVLGDATGTGTIANDDPWPLLSIGPASAVEGHAGTTNLVFPVSLDRPSGSAVSAAWATADGTAVAGMDYAAATGLVTLAAGVTSATVAVSVSGDVLLEADETLLVSFSSVQQATVQVAQAVGTILNDDAGPALSVSGQVVTEGLDGTTGLVFNVTLSAASALDTTVDFATANGTATAGVDYVATTGSLQIAAGDTTATVTVPVLGDALFEPDETLLLTLSGAANATIGVAQATGTIANDDTAPIVSIEDLSADEGHAGVSNFAVRVGLSAPAGLPVTVRYATTAGSASNGSDFAATTGTAVIAAGTTGAFIQVAVQGDVLHEADETFLVSLSSASNAVLGEALATVTIRNDDATPVLTVSDLSAQEGNAGTTSFVFRLTLSSPSALEVEVDYATVDGTASNGSDYGSTAGTLVFAAGATGATVAVQVTGDALFEGNETFELRLTNAVHALLGDASGLGTILNDDNVPAIFVAAATVTEGQAGTTNLLFVVSLSQSFAQDISVSFATSNGTAVAGADYIHTSGVAVIPAGQTLGAIAVAVNGDTDYEANETLLLLLATPTNATLSALQANGTINNDDPLPAVSIADLAAAEGNAGDSNFLVRVELSRASAFAVTAGYTTVAGTAATGEDFGAASGRLVVPAGATNATIAIAVQGDTVYETNEFLEVRLTNAANATLADTQAVVTILNDDALPALSIADASEAEGDAGTSLITFTVSAPNASAFTVTVAYATANGTASNGTDFTAVAGTLVLPPGATSATIEVSVNGDTTLEPAETFTLALSNATQAALADATATGTILNDDPVPEISLSGGAEYEGDAGTTTLVFTAYLSFPIPFPVTVNYATANNGATAGSDYVGATGTLTFAAGVDTAALSVTVIGDTMYEAGEQVRLNLSAPTNATLAQAFATGTILNDDSLPAVSIQDVVADEGNAGSTGFVFVVELSNASAYPVTVDFATANDSALAGSDYTAASGSLLFGPGTTVQTIAVSVLGDTTAESNESFLVNLDGAAGAFVTDPYGFGTIVNDDGLPTGYSAFAAQIPDAAQRGEQMDPDGDGYPNLLEYVTGGNPNVPDAVAHLDASRAGPVVSLRFNRATNAVDATLFVEGSLAAADESIWTPIATNAAGSWGPDTGQVTETGTGSPVAVSVADPVPAATNRFLRLRAVLP